MNKADKQKLIDKVNKAASLQFTARVLRGIKNFSRKREVKKLLRNVNVKFTETEMFTGDKINVVVPDNVSTGLYLNGCFEPDDTKGLIECLNEGDTFIDIGAHIGYYSIIASGLVAEKGRVICFEPTPST